MSLNKLPAPKKQSSLTDELPATGGYFQLSSIPIRYYMTSVPLGSLARSFKLVEDVPGSEKWGYNAIFQRDINEQRVKDELVDGYLRDLNKFKFFNPLTIALLPYDAAGQKILDSYRAPATRNESDGLVTEQIDGITIVQLADQPLGRIQWDTDSVLGLAIDGQHRLSALLEYAKAPSPGIDPSQCLIPVVLLVFDVERGDIVKQIREIFVDINKTAQPVSLARKILLDDRDPFCIMARDLIADYESATDGLPYEVVDWRRDTNKPDGAHQLSNIIVLYNCVRFLFGKRVKTIDIQLGVNAELKKQRANEVNFDTSGKIANQFQAKALLKRFGLKHKRFMLAVLRGVKPYAAFLKELNRRLTMDHGDRLREYLFKPEPKRAETKRQLEVLGIDVKKVIDDSVTALSELKDNDHLLTFSVGQRGLFSMSQKVIMLYKGILETVDHAEIGKAFVKDLNALDDRGFFRRDLKIGGFAVWEGICLQLGVLQWSEAAATRIGCLILLCAAARQLEKDDDLVDTRVGRTLRLDSCLRRIVTVYSPLMSEPTSEYDEGAEAADDLDDEEEYEDSVEGDDEEPSTIDAEAEANAKVIEILKWARGLDLE
jgi:hypothetical protein